MRKRRFTEAQSIGLIKEQGTGLPVFRCRSKDVRRERPPDCPEIRTEMPEIAGKRRWFGYRRIGALRGRKGMVMAHKSCISSTERKISR